MLIEIFYLSFFISNALKGNPICQACSQEVQVAEWSCAEGGCVEKAALFQWALPGALRWPGVPLATAFAPGGLK